MIEDKTYLIHYRDRSVIPPRWAFEEVEAKNKAELFSKVLPKMSIPECEVVLAVEMGVHMFSDDVTIGIDAEEAEELDEVNEKEVARISDYEVLLAEAQG